MDERIRIGRAILAVLPRMVIVSDGHGEDGYPFFDVQPSGTHGGPYRIRATWIGEGWPRQVQQALERTPLPDLLVCKRISPGARQLAEEAGIGWLDEAGAANFAIDGLIVSKDGRKIDQQPSSPRWTESTIAVAEALLIGIPGTVEAMHNAIGLSVGSCVRALRTLTELELLTNTASRGRNSERRIKDIDSLLDAYQQQTHLRRSKQPVAYGHVLLRDSLNDVINMALSWEEKGVVWAATGALASLVRAPYLTNVTTVELYVDRTTVNELHVALEMIGASIAPKNAARIALRPFPTLTSKRFVESHSGLKVVPLPRVYADLFEVGVRGGEAADHLKEVTHLGIDS